nr:outer membrane protein - Chlamydia trachomatis (serotype C) (fragments) [Chlamydia trachomatis]
DVNKEFQMGAAPTTSDVAGLQNDPTTNVARPNPAYGKHMQNLVGLFGTKTQSSSFNTAKLIPNTALNEAVVELYIGYVGAEFPLNITAGTEAATGTKAQPKLAEAILDVTTLNPTIAGKGSVVSAGTDNELADTMQ